MQPTNSNWGQEDEEEFQSDLQKLGPVKKDKKGQLDFDYLIKLLEIVDFKGKNLFQVQKVDFIRQRRDAL